MASIIREGNLLKPTQETLDLRPPKDHIEGNKIILDAQGQFPKELIILHHRGKMSQYKIVKSRNDKFQLNR